MGAASAAWRLGRLAGERSDEIGVLRILAGEGVAFGELEVGEVESRGNGAADQGIFAFGRWNRGEPGAGLNDGLEAFAFFRIGAKAMGDQLAVVVDLIYEKGIAKIKMPYFVGGNPVESRELSTSQQEINSGGSVAVALEKYWQAFAGDSDVSPIGLAERAAFHVFDKVQFFYPVGCVGSIVHFSIVTCAAYTSANESLMCVVSLIPAAIGKYSLK